MPTNELNWKGVRMNFPCGQGNSPHSQLAVVGSAGALQRNDNEQQLLYLFNINSPRLFIFYCPSDLSVLLSSYSCEFLNCLPCVSIYLVGNITIPFKSYGQLSQLYVLPAFGFYSFMYSKVRVIGFHLILGSLPSIG